MSPVERFMAMGDAEKEREWEKYNRIIPLSETRPLTEGERREFERWRKKAIAEHRRRRGRPRVGKGTQIISISVERGLLKTSDGFAKRKGVKRSQMIAAGLRAVMKDPSLLGAA